MDATDVVVELNAVVQAGGGVPEEDLVGAEEPERTVGLLLAEIPVVSGHPVIDHGGLAERVGASDSDAHGAKATATGWQLDWEDWLSAGLRAVGQCIPGHTEKNAARGVTANHGS
jgi:hypothetical protein